MSRPISSVTGHSDAKQHRGHRRDIEILMHRVASHGPWITPGTDGGPSFLSGFDQAGGGLQLFRFRQLIAGGIEVQGSVDFGAPGAPVCNIAAYVDELPDGELRLPGSDSAGAFVVFRLTPDGDLIFGL